MLQRAASNAYSWWWASHIRTKQSKWLEQNLQDMEEKVAYTLKLIEEDGDSFAKRAEMYYKKRPELINFVEEAYRAYRALAERYDHISTELQNANTTIAAVFPEQVQFAIDDGDEDALPKTLKRPTQIQKQNIPNVPKTPIKKDLKSIVTTATRKLRPSKSTKKAAAVAIVKSGLTKSEGLKEIDQLQKRILALQTEKEFVKSSYESRLAKYWEIESQIKEMQERVSRLHDEFGEGIVIEDEEARSLMTSAALKSCQETLAQLQEKQERSAEEAKVEHKKIKDAREKFESLKDEFHGNEISQKKPSVKDDSMKAVDELERLNREVGSATQDREEAESSRENIKEQIEVGSSASLTVTEMAEKIDEIVNKVVSLETAFSSQTSLIRRLRTETDELQTQIRTLEVEKMTLFNNKTDLSNKLMETEEKLHRLQGLNSNVEDHNNNLQAAYTEARNLDYLSDKPHSQNSDRELEFSSQKEKCTVKVKLQEEIDGQQDGVKLQEDIDGQEDGVKLQEERDGQEDGVKLHEERDGQEDGVKLQEEIDGQEDGVKLQEEIDGQVDGVNPNDDLMQLEKLEQEKTSQKEESIVQVRLQVEIDGQEGTTISNDDLKRLQSTELAEELLVKTSSEKENTSPVKGQYHKEFEGSECAPNLATDRQHSEKPDEEPKVTGLTQKQEISMVRVGSLEEFKDQEEKLNYTDATKRVRDVETTAAEDIKQHDHLTMPGIQGKVMSELLAKDEPGNLLEQSEDQITLDKVNNQTSSQAPDNFLNVERQEQTIKRGDEPDWKQMFLNGIENREKVLLKEYTAVLRNYKELKKKHDEEDMISGGNISQITVQLEELRNANAKKDEEIRFLLEKLRILQAGMDENNNLHDQSAEQKLTVIETSRTLPPEREVEILLVPVDQPQITSEIEENFRMSIDELLEANLDFWLRFSTSFHEIQKFETEVKDLQAEVSKLQEKQKKSEGSNSIKYSLKSDVRPLYKHLREIQTELTVWMEKCALLKEELTSRFSSLCNIQEEITGALKTSAEDDDFKFTSYQAAKFQGEVLNMKQENNKVADELQAGLDHVTGLQLDIEKTLTLLSEEFGLSQSKHESNMELPHSDSKSRVPLRSFIFGVKQKKQRPSLLSCMHPALAKKYNGLRSGSNR